MHRSFHFGICLVRLCPFTCLYNMYIYIYIYMYIYIHVHIYMYMTSYISYCYCIPLVNRNNPLVVMVTACGMWKCFCLPSNQSGQSQVVWECFEAHERVSITKTCTYYIHMYVYMYMYIHVCTFVCRCLATKVFIG